MHIDQRQQIISAKYKHFLFKFSNSPSICLKDSNLFAATDHHCKVETFSLSVVDLSINLLKGHISIIGNRSSSESRNSVSFGSGSIPPNLLEGLTNISSLQSRKSHSFRYQPVLHFTQKTSAI